MLGANLFDREVDGITKALNAQLGPTFLDLQDHGVLPPAFEILLAQRQRAGMLSDDQVHYYARTLIENDRNITRRLHGLDGVLREDARARLYNPWDAEPVPWKCVKHIGSGGYGAVLLWSRERPGPNVIEYLATKDGKGQHWYGDYNSEFYMMRRLNERGCKNVIEAYDQGRYMKSNTHLYRMAIEWCNRGDLSALRKFYQRTALVIPESFIWHVALSLAKGLLYCHNGGIHEEVSADWDPMFHGDLKEANIMLKDPEDPGQIFPDVKIGDFGLAYTLPNEAIRSCKRTYRGGTRGYRDPRMELDEPRTIQSDIYSYGKTLKRLVDLFNDQIGKRELALLRDRPDLFPKFIEDYYPYSRGLVTFVDGCLAEDPKDRYTTWDCYLTANKAWTDLQPKLAVDKASAESNGLASDNMIIAGDEQVQGFNNNPEFQEAVRMLDWWTYKGDDMDVLDDIVARQGTM